MLKKDLLHKNFSISERIFKIAFILLFGIFHCSENKDSRTLKIGISSDIGSIDPLFATDLTSRKLNSIYFRKLFQKGKNGEIQKDLVRSYVWEKEKLTLTIEDDFLNVEDVLYSLNRAIQVEHPLRSLFELIQDIQKLSETKILISCKCTLEEVLSILSDPASSIFKKSSDLSNVYLSKKNISILKWSRGNEILFNYIHPKFDKIKFQVVGNSFTGIYLFKNKKLHVFKLPYFFYTHPAVSYAKFVSYSGNSVQYIAINSKNSCFDKNFRLALNLAIDRKKIIEKIFFGLAETTYMSFPKKYTYPNLQSEDFTFEYSPEQAKKYLQKSTCFEKLKSQTLDFRLRADDENKAKGLALAHYLQEIGLKVKLYPMEKAPLYKENDEGRGDLTLLTWYADYDSALNFLDPLFASDKWGNGGNRSFYKNARMDEIIQLSRKKFLLSEDLQKEAIQILKEDLPWVFLWSLNENYLLQEDLDLEEFKDFLF